MSKYGVNHPFLSNEIKRKIKNRNLEKYGTDSHNKVDEIKEKQKKTRLLKYGGEWTLNSPILIKKVKNTLLRKYGVQNITKLKSIRQKIKLTNIKKYGVDSWAKTEQGKLCHRINAIKRTENQKNNGEPLMPNIGEEERIFLDKCQKYLKYNIIRNDQSFRYIIGRYPDGHIPELKLFIQFDEEDHFLDKDCKVYRQDDIDCTLQLASLGYIVWRVSKKNWLNNKQNTLKIFKEIIKELQLC